jgi:hypothetical protein
MSDAIFRIVIAAGLILATLSLSVPAAAAEVAGVRLPDRVQLVRNGPQLVLNGAGVRFHAVFKVYVAALYLPLKTDDSETILQANQPSRVTLQTLRTLTAEQITSSMMAGMQESLTPVQRMPLEKRMQEFSAILESLSELKKGSQIVIDYMPASGTIIRIDGVDVGRVAGADFNSALLRVWIGERPRDERLKKAMLGTAA